MIDTMKPEKHSVAVVVRGDDGTFLAVRRPDDPEDPLGGLWGLPAVTMADGEDELAAAIRVGRAKLGIKLALGPKIGAKTADRGEYVLFLSEYEATIASGTGGSANVHVNGSSVISLTGVNTQATANPSANQVLLTSNFGVNNINCDDLYVLNTSGSVNNDFLGECRVWMSLPTGDDARFKQWTPSTGTSHFANLDDANPNDAAVSASRAHHSTRAGDAPQPPLVHSGRRCPSARTGRSRSSSAPPRSPPQSRRSSCPIAGSESVGKSCNHAHASGTVTRTVLDLREVRTSLTQIVSSR